MRIGEVAAATAYAMSVMHGFETGIACARLRIKGLAQHLESEPAVHEPPLVDMRVRNALARQGLWVWDTNWRGDGVEVVLDNDVDDELHRVLAGVLGAALEAPAQTHWHISERYGDHSLEIRPQAVAAARGLLPHGARHGPIDVNVLLPLLAEIKIAGGDAAKDVARELTRIALRHPLGVAQAEASAILRRDDDAIGRLNSTLEVAERALSVAWDLVGVDPDQGPLLENLREARIALVAWRAGERARILSLEYHLNRLFDDYHTLPDA